MQPVVISRTIQSFKGLRYYLCGFYFQRDGKRLHRAVWEHHHGPVPVGHHVHHVDGDLVLLAEFTHLSGHSKRSKHERAVAAMQAAAKRWHGSDAGKQWHREHVADSLGATWIRDVERECSECGRTYMAARGAASRSYVCSNACKSVRFRRLNPGYDRRFKRTRR